MSESKQNSFSIKQPAKKITLAILIITFLVGLTGCFLKFFDMDKYAKFLASFSPFFVVMITSIGTGAVVDRLKGDKKKVEE